MFFLFFLFFFLFLLEPVTRLLRARIGYLIKQLFAWRNSLPLNDIQHQECQNPGFEQEPPQILQLTETTINNVLIWKEMKQKSTAGKKCNKANYFLSRYFNSLLSKFIMFSIVTTETKMVQALVHFLRKDFRSYNPLQLLPTSTRCNSNILG